MRFWENKEILVTGGAGFLGHFLVKRLLNEKARVFIPVREEYDLTEQMHVRKLFKEHPADFVFHLAVTGGGIGYLREIPGKSFYDNIMMDTMVMEEARKADVTKFIGIGTVCAYPKFCPVPFREEDLWNGFPEETNAPYGLSKKMMIPQSFGYRQQYGFNSINLLLVNLYGPRDDFDPRASHVIPALIRKCLEGREKEEREIIVWGDGSASREFLYVDDAAEGILLAAEKYNESDPINLGSGKDIKIQDLVKIIVTLTGFNGKIHWDTSKPNGQPKRQLDTSKAKEKFDFSAKTSFEEGLKKAVEWYEQARKK